MGKRTELLFVVAALAGCAFLQAARPVARDVAVPLCEIWAAEQPAERIGGLSPTDFCAIAKNLEPYTREADRVRREGARSPMLVCRPPDVGAVP